MRGDVHVRFGGRAEETDHADEAGTAHRPDPYTYVPTWQGFLFLAVVIDANSRRCVGWSMRDDLRAELVIDALGMAVSARRPVAGEPPKRRAATLQLEGRRPAYS